LTSATPTYPRLGLQVFGTRTGLGYQTRALYRHLQPAKTMLIDMSRIKGMPLLRDWYGSEVSVVDYIPTDDEIDAFLDGLDVVLVCETPLNYRLFSRARERGVVTILQYNYEFLEYLTAAGRSLPRPDILAAPTSWNTEDVRARLPDTPVLPLPVPVDARALDLPARTITRAHTFFHIAGLPTAGDRNGTLDFIAAAKACADLAAGWILYCQAPNAQIRGALAGAPNVELVREVDHPGELYERGDILVLPRRYGGLCLPMQEALAAGIPVVMPDIPPNRDRLPQSWLVPAHHTHRTDGGYPPVPVDVHRVDHDALVGLLRALHADPDRVAEMGGQARRIGAGLGWDALLPEYVRFIEDAAKD
jgi:glycosyltransferase involved in cell wall biosynthesis